MACLTKDEVLQGAGQTVNELYSDLEDKNLTPEELMEHITDYLSIMKKTVEVLELTIYNDRETVH